MSSTPARNVVSRRAFLQAVGAASGLLLLSACATATPPANAPAEAGDTAAPAAGTTPIIATTQMALGQWDPTLERAKELLPNIDLTITQTSVPGGWSAYSDQIVTTIAGGEQLDVIMIAVEGIRLLTARNILVPLDEFFEADPEAQEVLMNDVHETLRGMLQVDGKQMEYPFSWNNMVLYYNTAIFEEKGIEPPTEDWTWDEFLDTCLQIADVQGGADDLYAYSFWGGGMFGMHAWYFNNDTSVLTEDWADSNLMDPKVAETLIFLRSLILEHKVSPNPTGWDEWAQFHAGHLAMRTCGRWCISGSLNEGFETYDLQYQPHAAGPTKTVAGTDGWGISSSTQNTDLAWEVVKLLSGTEAAIDMVQTGGNIPALRPVAEMPVFSEYGPSNTAIFYASLDYAKTVPSPANFNIVEPILDRAYQTIWNGEQTVEAALAAAHEELQAEMDKFKA